MKNDLRVKVLLSIQRALLGEITDCMRAISVSFSLELIDIRIYTEGDASDETRDDFDAAVITQVIADLDSDAAVIHRFERCGTPSQIPFFGVCVFARKGVRFQQNTAEHSCGGTADLPLVPASGRLITEKEIDGE
jgi:hypothetical protein